MTWTYNGDPSSSDVAKYRFLIGDTEQDGPVLQDEEIQYIINTYSDENPRLYRLFDAAATVFARKIKKSLGPQSEDPSQRLSYFTEKATYYRKIVASSSGLSLPKSADTIFYKGMHDNV